MQNASKGELIMSDQKAAFIQHLCKLSMEGLAHKLVSTGEQHSEAEDFFDKLNLSARYDIITAVGKYRFGKHEFDRAVDEAIAKVC